MTLEQQRIAIAEACGWRLYGSKRFGVTDAFPSGPPQEIHDYLNDLNAMHEAEKKLSPKDCYIYNANLCKLMGDWTPQSSAPNWVFHATAAQRAEAFLRTLNRWTE